MACLRLHSLVYTVPFPAGFDRKEHYVLLKLIKRLRGRSVLVKIVLRENSCWRPFLRRPVRDPRDKALQKKLGRGLEQAMDTYRYPHVRIVAADADSGFHALRRLFKLCRDRGVTLCASVNILQLHQQWWLPSSIGPELCHLQGRQLQQRLKLVGLVTGWFKSLSRQAPQAVGRLVWEYLGGDCLGDLLLTVHRESEALLEQRVLQLYKFRMAALCFQRFAHQPASIVERTRQQFRDLILVADPPDMVGGHENNMWWPSGSLYLKGPNEAYVRAAAGQLFDLRAAELSRQLRSYRGPTARVDRMGKLVAAHVIDDLPPQLARLPMVYTIGWLDGVWFETVHCRNADALPMSEVILIAKPDCWAVVGKPDAVPIVASQWARIIDLQPSRGDAEFDSG